MTYPPESDQNIYIDNDKGAVQLSSSLRILVKRPGSSVEEEIGTAYSAEVSESRTILYNFVIGNGTDPSTARDLIPGPVAESTIRLQTMALYIKNIIAALGARDAARWMSSLRYQTRYFTIKEKVVHPNTPKVREIVYEGCMIKDYSKSQTYSGGGSDIRTLENVTIAFKKAYVAVDEITSDS